MVGKKRSFKQGTQARATRGKVAEDFKAQGDSDSVAFAKATKVTKGVKSEAGLKRLAKHGIRKKAKRKDG